MTQAIAEKIRREIFKSCMSPFSLINVRASAYLGHALAQLVEALRWNRKYAGLIPDGADSASNRYVYRNFSYGVKAAGA
jgi:hypothetical protein